MFRDELKAIEFNILHNDILDCNPRFINVINLPVINTHGLEENPEDYDVRLNDNALVNDIFTAVGPGEIRCRSLRKRNAAFEA